MLFYTTMMVTGIVLAGWSHGVFAADSGAKTKRVCHDEQRQGKTVTVCKTIRVHKKLEGTTVPTGK